MNQQKSNYQVLIANLDKFIRKYYINKLIRGSLYTIGILLAVFIVYSVAEYYLYFGTGMRKFLFYSFLLLALGGFSYWVIDPLVRYFQLGKTISHEDAAVIIGNHFGDVKDKLLNILQLKKLENQQSTELLTASIDQKTEAIRLVPFQSAIDLNKNRKYLKYALPPFLLLIVILFAAPSMITDSTNRIINNDKKFEKAAPFKFLIDNRDLSVVQFRDYDLKVHVEGEVMPNEVYVSFDNFQYKMTRESGSTFSYTFKNVQKNRDFTLNSGKVSSASHTLKVLAKPNMANFKIDVDYPAYTGRTDETVQNMGDLVVPEGTKLNWLFDVLNTDNISYTFGEESDKNLAERKSGDKFVMAHTARHDLTYKLFLSNQYVTAEDSMVYSISVIKDQYPTISVEQIVDSLNNNLIYFVGTASDDYGLNTLSFNYSVIKENGNQEPLQKEKLSKEAGREIQFSHVFDLNELKLAPGDNISYYFEVNDNDAVNGSKSARTSVMTYNKPTIEELRLQEESNDQAIKDELKDALDKLKKLQENMNKLQDKLLQKNDLDWQDKKEMEKILDEQKKLQEQIEQAKERLEENMKNRDENDPLPEELQEMQDALKELFDNAADPETKELMDKIQELLQELDKEDAVEMLEQFKNNSDAKEKEMNRLLELYKQLEMEKNIMDQIRDLEKLADDQEKLSEESQKGEKSQEDLKQEQDDLNKRMDDLMDKQKDLEKKNKELKAPKDMGQDNQEQMEDAKDDMEKSSDQLDKEQNDKAAKSQKKAAQKMKEQAKSMAGAMQGSKAQQASEDVKTLRQLLENLIKISFDQEDLFEEVTPYTVNSPAFPESIRKQFKLQSDFRIVEDTLVALSNRNPDIQSYVMDKVAEIKLNFKESIEQLVERRVAQGQEKQRRTMKNLNDLALMMNESLDQAQQQAMGMPGSGSCDNPGGTGSGDSDKPIDKITQGQKELSEGLQKMKGEGDQEGEGEGEQGGEEGQSGKDGMSAKDYAQAAAQQAALRKALEELQKSKIEQGQGSKLLDEIIKNMDGIETELVNKRLNNETLKRMKDIETRLLEAQKAERQRELDEKRISRTAQDMRRELPPNIQEYIKQRQSEIDMYKSVSPSLKPYYKSLVDDYYKSLKSGQ